MSEIYARTKIWLEVDGQPFLGDGRYRLLSAIEKNGSINAAARDLNISYRRVWAQLQAMEESAPFPILERRIGGKGGGASHLTPEAIALLERYAKFRQLVRNNVDGCFASSFPEEDQDRC